MNGQLALDKLDSNKTALVVVHMVKGVAGEVDTPFNRLFRHRAKEKGIIKAQLRLLDGFRKAEAKVVYTAVTYQPGLPGVSPNSPLWLTLFDCVCLMESTPAVELMDELARRPDEPLVRGQAANAGSVAGLVTDSSGGTVLGATITLKDKATGTPRTTTKSPLPMSWGSTQRTPRTKTCYAG